MKRKLRYFFSCISPFAYLGQRELMSLAEEFGLEIEYYPLPLLNLLSGTGGVPLGQRPQVRKDYRLLEMQRWGEYRGVPIILNPAHFPTSPELADRSAIVLAASGADVADFTYSVMRACWADDLNIADEAIVAECITCSGSDAADILEQAMAPAIGEIYQQNVFRAISEGVFGLPAYVLEGELFWGQDRLEFLRQVLRTNWKAA